MSGTATLNTSVRVITGLIGLALFGYFLLFFAREATKMTAWRNAGGLRSENRFVDSLIVFTKIDATDFLTAAIPQVGDTVTAVNDTPVTVDRWNIYFDSLRAPGEEIPVSFRHAANEHRTVIFTRGPLPHIFWLMIALQVLRFLIGAISIGVGLWAFFARPDSAAVRALAFFSFAMGAFMISGVSAVSGRFASFTIPYMDQISQALMMLVVFTGAFWLNLQMLFPRPVKFMREHPAAAYIICYGLPVLILGVQGILLLTGNKAGIGMYLAIAALLQIIAGFVLLTVRHRRATDRLERRQTRLVLLGSGTGLGLLFLLVVVANIYSNAMPGGLIGGLLMINAAFMALLLSPLSFAYAFGRYRLLDVEGTLRRGTRYVLVTAVMLAAVFGILYVIGSGLVMLLGISSRASMLLLALGLGVVFARARGTLQELLERWFYPERRRLRQMISDFLQHALSIVDKDTFWSELQMRLREGLRVERVHPVLLAAGNGHYSCIVAGVTPFTTQSVFLGKLARERRPVLVDEEICLECLDLTSEEIDWLETQRVGLVLPLISHSNLIGFLGLGQKSEKEDYAAEELRILESLSSQIALASENIRLLEDNIIKKQLEEQLQIARRIQKGFLPQEIPPTTGLEIAAASRFCLDVAGDYYDVIPLEDGRTVLAVGDVSGKGAGAALLMANLQASLRTAVGMGNALDDVVARVNNLIHRNTPPEQFITFFVSIYDSKTAKLTYVNAGHYPPILLRRNGEMRALDKGGLILGCLPAMLYEQETIALKADDLIVMYTDGVSEATNATDEMFGDRGICDFVCSRQTQPVKQILTALEDEVVQFRGEDSFDDDFTLLLVRVV